MPGDVVGCTATPPYQMRAASPEHQPLGGRTTQTEPPPGITKATRLVEFMTTKHRVLSTKPGAVRAAKRGAKPTVPVAAANQTAPPTKKTKMTSKERSRCHRAPWKRQATTEQAQPRPWPRPLATLRSLTPEAILQPEGGFRTKAQFQVAVGELCVKEGKIATCSNSTTRGVGRARRRLGNALGSSDLKHVRYVCASSPTCGFVADAFCRYTPDTDGFLWQFERFCPHTCSWDPPDGAAAIKATRLGEELQQLQALSTKMPISWVGLDTLHGAELVLVPGKDAGLVATVHLEVGHIVADIAIPSYGTTYHRQGTVDRRTDILASWYGFGCDGYEVVPSQMTNELTGLVTMEAAPLFACNEPSFDKTINCKVFVTTVGDGAPLGIRLYTITTLAPGEELTIFYGTNRHDASYPRNAARWNADDATGLDLLNVAFQGV